MMKLLLLGGGGREHALAWKLAQSSRVQHIAVLPGNGGTAQLAKCENVQHDDPLRYAREHAIDLTIVGPEQPLAAGMVDAFHAAGLKIWGPTRAAARLESSKAFAKAFMQRHGLPTAEFGRFEAPEPALRYVQQCAEHHDTLPVIKASGLAAGKGVVLPESLAEAEQVVRAMLSGDAFAGAGREIIIEQRLQGRELSLLAFCDGSHVQMLPAVQDYKRLQDGDVGPNTGGMGTFSPVPHANLALMAEAQDIMQRTVTAMANEGHPFVGVLFAGFMHTRAGLQLLEYNCRFGDPETQVLMPLLETDLLSIIEASLAGELAGLQVRTAPRHAVNVVLASAGYPADYAKGKPIHGIDQLAHLPDVQLFHAGTRVDAQGQLHTAGGRVLNVVGLGDSQAQARAHAYQAVDVLHFEGMYYRRDIAR